MRIRVVRLLDILIRATDGCPRSAPDGRTECLTIPEAHPRLAKAEGSPGGARGTHWWKGSPGGARGSHW